MAAGLTQMFMYALAQGRHGQIDGLVGQVSEGVGGEDEHIHAQLLLAQVISVHQV